MLERKVVVKVNSNFQHLAGENLFTKDDSCFNTYRKKWEEWPQTFHIGDFPLFIDIETTSVCNLRCPFCATTFREDMIKKGFISFDIVKKIIDEGADKNLYGVKFNLRGEPLLHSQIHEFVKYAKKKGLIDVYFNTNATFLTKEMANRLIDAGLDRITISLEGYNKETYERYRVGANFQTVLANINNLRALKNKLSVDYPKIRIQAVKLPGAEDICEEYKRFWSERTDELAFIDYKEMKIKKRGIRYHWACPQLWQRMAVWWDGTILPCNHDDDGLIALGNINEMTIEEAWISERLNRLRDIHKNGKAHQIAACDGCYLRDSEISKLKNKNEQ